MGADSGRPNTISAGVERPVTPRILVLCPGRESRQVVENQLGNLHSQAAYLTSRSELRGAAAGAHAVVSDLFDGEGRQTAAFLRDLQTERPEIKIIVSYDPSPAALDDALDVVTCGARFAFAARPFNHVGHLLEPLLRDRSTRAPSNAPALAARVIPQVETAPARRCVTLAAVNPAHRIPLKALSAACDATDRTLHRHLEGLAPPKLLLSALAWPQANYFLTDLHWNPRQVAAYFGYPRPALLIDLLGDYVESGLWKLGLDASVDGIAAATEESSAVDAGWLHHRRFRIRASNDLALTAGASVSLGPGLRGGSRPKQIIGNVISLLGSGLSPLEVVRRLWRRNDVDLPDLYRGVMQVVQVARSQGVAEEIGATG